MTFPAFNLPSMKILLAGSGSPGGVLEVTERTPCTRIPTCFIMLSPRKMLHGFANSGYASLVSVLN
jgi:hypothetical protein